MRLGKNEIETLQPIFFDTDRSRVRHAFYNILGQIGLLLKAHPEIGRCAIEGHTDETGPPEWNQKLSVLRAESVIEFLVGKGVDRKRLVAIGHGEKSPWVSNDTEWGRSRNRRVVFHIEGVDTEFQKKQIEREERRQRIRRRHDKATGESPGAPSEGTQKTPAGHEAPAGATPKEGPSKVKDGETKGHDPKSHDEKPGSTKEDAPRTGETKTGPDAKAGDSKGKASDEKTSGGVKSSNPRSGEARPNGPKATTEENPTEGASPGVKAFNVPNPKVSTARQTERAPVVRTAPPKGAESGVQPTEETAKEGTAKKSSTAKKSQPAPARPTEEKPATLKDLLKLPQRTP